MARRHQRELQWSYRPSRLSHHTRRWPSSDRAHGKARRDIDDRLQSTNSPRRSCDVLAVSSRSQTPGGPQRRFQSDRIGLIKRLYRRCDRSARADDVGWRRIFHMHRGNFGGVELGHAAKATDEAGIVEAASFVSGFGSVAEFNTTKVAAVHMEDTTPADIVSAGGTVAAPVKSLYQTDAIGLKTTLWATWGLRAAGHCQYITGATW